MAKVIITRALVKEVERTFKNQSEEVFSLMKSVEQSPKKGKTVGNIGGVVIKELKYGSHRFYFITDGAVLKFGSQDELASLLIKFVALSKKNDQQKTISQIKTILEKLGFEGL